MKSKASSLLILLLGSVLWLAVQGANAICPVNLCGGGADNYHPHPSDCAKFCQCVHGNPIEMPCAHGTVFSDKVNVCVHKDSELDECTNSNVVIVESSEDVERECQKGTVSLIPHPTACQRYYNCSDTSTRGMYNLFGKYENECDYPELFDINEKKCVNYKVAKCGKGRIAATWKCDYLANKCPRSHCIPCEVHNPSCVGKEDGMWPHTSKLWSPYFTTCDSERSVNGEETCPRDDKIGAHQLFHPDKRQCLPLWEIPREHGGYKPSCEDKPPGVYEIEGMQIIAYQCPGEEKFLCKPPYHIYQDLSKCSRIRIVESLTKIEQECKKGTVRLIPHPTACQRYYDCSDTSMRMFYSFFGKYENECDYPDLFDINEKKCVNYKVANCGKGRIAATWKCDYLANKCARAHCKPCDVDNPSCVGKEDGVWPHTWKLWSPYFTTCDSERSVNGEETCPRDDKIGAHQLFHPDKRQCLPLWEIPREHGGYKPSCEDKPPGVYEIEGMQIIAYQCPGEEKFLCKPPYHINQDLSECSSLRIVLSPQKIEQECQKGTVSLIPHPTACQRYYDCSDTSTRDMYNFFGKYENECDYPDLFDINEKKCVNYKVANCGKGRIAATWKCDYLASKCTRSHCIPCQVRNPSCVGKEDGMWPHTSKLWSPYFTTCDSERSVNGEERCPIDDELGATQLFHPDKRQCLPLWEIPRKHGGYKPSCEDKPPGVYEIEGMQIIAYQCPGEKKFLCRPPYHITQDLSGCIPLSEESNDY